MPTYDYKCPKCEIIQQFFHKMCEEISQLCPHCGVKMTKCISAGIGLHFKGSGFYETDYKCKE